MSKLLYIGAGTHIEPVDNFSDVTEFVFVDTKPRTHHETPYFDNKCYDKNFTRTLIDKCLDRKFKLSKSIVLEEYWATALSLPQKICYMINNISELINPTLLIFDNPFTGQKIKYYISTSILYNMHFYLKTDIEQSHIFMFDALTTNVKILEYFINPKICVGYIENNYDVCKYDDNTLLHFLNNNTCSTAYYFSDFYLVENISRNTRQSQMKACETFSELKIELEIARRENSFCRIDVNLCNFV